MTLPLHFRVLVFTGLGYYCIIITRHISLQYSDSHESHATKSPVSLALRRRWAHLLVGVVLAACSARKQTSLSKAVGRYV